MAYDLAGERAGSVLGTALALKMVAYDTLFAANAAAFAVSALLVLSVRLPAPRAVERDQGVWHTVTFGLRVYPATPPLRALLALSCAGAMVIVNTVVYVRERLGGTKAETALALAAAGAGSMVAAFALPRLLDGRPAVFAAQFALSHACWLIAYPLAGWVGTWLGLDAAFAMLAAVTLVSTAVAWALWPADDPQRLAHVYEPMTHDHLHVHDEHHQHDHEGWEGPEPHSHPHHHGRLRREHAFVVDLHHPAWPTGQRP